jgi:type I restriction enzyme R subunit
MLVVRLMSPPAKTEEQAREQIDADLIEAGWIVQDRRDMNVAAGLGVAIREFKTDAGFADYLLYVDRKPVGVLEAKKEGVTLTGVEAQTREYAERVPKQIPVPLRPLPFLYESTGVETRFTNLLDPIPRSRKLYRIHQPQILATWLDQALAIQTGRPDALVAATFLGRMQRSPSLNTAGMWPAQIRAVEKLEASIKQARPRALIQMATGSGKTFTAISAVYRMIKHGEAGRVLFLVDRGNLGRQALKEFQAYTTPDDGRKFTELYNVRLLRSNKLDPVNRVVITTIQRLYSILKGDPEFDDGLEEGSAFAGSGAAIVREPQPVVYAKHLPPEFFDVLVIDECHRSIYSLWRQVLEYFDASLIGLTATPSRHTYAFFDKNVVSEYRHEHAVRDKVNVPYEVYEIHTRISLLGSTMIAEDAAVIGKRHRLTRQVRWESLDEDISYAASALDRSVVAKDQIRTVIREFRDKLFVDIFPGRSEVPKTLFFAKNDSHAEDILEVIREEFSIGNEEAVKITYKPERAAGSPAKPGRSRSASQKPEDAIQRFRNSYNPRIAVTVDMIATGTDIKPLECVVFMRSVKSSGLFEQMKGRGVRVIPDADFQAVTPDAKVKTHFVIVDAVGVMHEQQSEPPIIRERGLTFGRVLELVRSGNRDEDILATLAGRLDRMDRRLTSDQRQHIAQAGGDLRQLVAELLDAIDPDREDAVARVRFKLAPDAAPTEAQLETVQHELREQAASRIAYDARLCQAILDVRDQQDQLIDASSIDEVIHSGPAPQHNLDYERELVDLFQSFIGAHRDEIDALQILYSRPYGQRLTRVQIKALADAICKPPRQWTTEALWGAYEKVEKGKVRAGGGRLWTDIVALARHALHPEQELVPFAEQVSARFENWLAQQRNGGREFSGEQMRWLEMIRDRIAGDAEVQVGDLDGVPFLNAGGLGRFYELFGDEYEAFVAELNAELVA